MFAAAGLTTQVIVDRIAVRKKQEEEARQREAAAHKEAVLLAAAAQAGAAPPIKVESFWGARRSRSPPLCVLPVPGAPGSQPLREPSSRV